MKAFGTPYAQVGEAQRLETATEWLLRLRERPDDDEVIVGWVQWCERDPRNQRAFERAQGVWRLSGGLAEDVVDGELTGPLPAALQGWRPRVRRLGFGLRRSLRRPTGVAAAAALLLAIGTALGGWQLRGSWAWLPVPAEAVVAAPARAVHHAELADGSRMQLAAKSTVAVEYNPTERQLDLQAGEAYFTVKPNPKRPFVVKVGEVRVRAVGTAFNVRRAGERIVVTVTEGVVDVFRATDAAEAEPVRLQAGGEVTWETAAVTAPVVASVDPQDALAWREGRLEYTDEPLSAVIADFNRYADHPVHITDPRVADLRFSGTLLTTLTGQWLHTLPRLFPIAIREQGDHLVIEALYQERT